MPLAMVLVMPRSTLVIGVSVAALLFLGILDAVGARAGRASVMKARLRVACRAHSPRR